MAAINVDEAIAVPVIPESIEERVLCALESVTCSGVVVMSLIMLGVKSEDALFILSSIIVALTVTSSYVFIYRVWRFFWHGGVFYEEIFTVVTLLLTHFVCWMGYLLYVVDIIYPTHNPHNQASIHQMQIILTVVAAATLLTQVGSTILIFT